MAAPVALAFRIAANLEAMRANLKDAVDQIETTKQAMTKMANSLDGSKLIADAGAMVKAVTDLGGASKLTETEQAKVNATLTEAIAKYEALGKTAPQAMKDLAAATQQTEQAGSSWVVRIAEGQLLRDAIREVIGALKDMAEFFPELAMRGAVVGDVEEAFQRLTTQVGLTSTALLTTLRAGTRGTIDDFALMQRANKDLAAGLNLTDAQFGTLAQGAFGLAKATGGNVKDALDAMSDAMVSAKPKAVALLTGKIDLKAAEEAYAESLGKTAQDLTGEGKLEADRAAILKAVEAALGRVGAQHDSLKDKVDRVKASWENFQDELGKTIARSPVLAAGFDGIQQALATAFGSDQTARIRTVAGLVDNIGLVLVDVGIGATAVAGLFVQAWGVIKLPILAVEQVVVGLIADLATLGEKSAGLAASMPGVGSKFANVAATTKDWGLQARAMAADLHQQFLDAQDLANGTSAVSKRLDEFGGALFTTREAMIAASKVNAEHAEALDNVSKSAKGTAAGVALIKPEVDKASKAFSEGLAKLTETLDAAAKNGMSITEQVKLYGEQAAKAAEEAKGWGKTVAKSVQDAADAYNAKKLSDVVAKDGDMIRGLYDKIMADALASVKRGITELSKAWESNQSVLVKVQDDYNALVARNEGDSLEGRLAAVSNYFDAERRKLDTRASNYFESLAKIDQIETATAQDATEKWNVHFQELQRAAATVPNFFRNAFQQIPNILAAAFSGGGGLGKALDGTLSQLGAALGGKGLTDLFNKGAGKLMETFGMGLTSTLGTIIPGLGQAIGSLLGPMLSKIAGLFSTAGRDAVTSFADSMGGFGPLHDKLDALGASGEALWVKLTQGVGRNDPAAAKAVIDEITKALDGAKQAADQLVQSQNSDLASLLGNLNGLGAGDLLQPYLDKLADAKGLSADNLSLIQQLAGDTTVSFDQMTKAASALGISTDSLGQSFQAAKAKADWQSVIDNLDTLQRGGANINDLLGDKGLQKKFDDLVVASQKFGTEIPANAKPWIEQLAKAGLLLDANGDKITDTSTLKFGGDLETSLQTLIDKIGLLLDKIAAVPGALDKIPAQKDITFNAKKSGDWPTPESGDDSGDTPAYGGKQAAGGDYWVTRPTAFIAGEAGGERVTFSGANRTSYPGSGQGGGNTALPVTIQLEGRNLWSGLLDVAHADGLT